VVRTSELTASGILAIHTFIMKDFKNKCVHMYMHNESNSAFNSPEYKSKTDLSMSVEIH